MKWGVRHDKPSGSRASKAAKILSPVGYGTYKGVKKAVKAYNSPNRKAKRAAKKSAKIERKRNKAMSVKSSAKYTYRQRKLLSDNELRSRINRLNMEKQLKDLSKGNGINISDDVSVKTGRKVAQKAIGTYGAKVLVSQIAPGAEKFVKPPKN